MAEQIAFTTAAFGGFEKKQVLDYIYKMHEEFDKEKTQHRKKLDDISVAFKELENRAVMAEGSQSQLQKELLMASSTLEEAKRAASKLALEKEELAQKLVQYERILAQRRSHDAPPMPEPVQEASPAHIQSPDDSARIGRVMLDAHAKANDLLNNAKGKAIQMITEARALSEKAKQQSEAVDTEKKALEAARKQLEEQSQAIIKSANEQAWSKIANSYAYSKQLFDEILKVTELATNNIKTLNLEVDNLSKSTNTISNIAGMYNPELPNNVTEPQPKPNNEFVNNDINDYPLPADFDFDDFETTLAESEPESYSPAPVVSEAPVQAAPVVPDTAASSNYDHLFDFDVDEYQFSKPVYDLSDDAVVPTPTTVQDDPDLSFPSLNPPETN